MRQRWVWIHGWLLPVVAVLALWGCAGEPVDPVAVGGPVPAFELPRLGGGSLASESLAGRPVVLNFWATWCQPCRKEFPVLNALHRDPRVDVVTVALDEEGSTKVAPFLEREGLEYLVLLGNQEIFERFGGYTIPYTMLIDPAQTVAAIYRGPASEESLVADLRRIGVLAEGQAIGSS